MLRQLHPEKKHPGSTPTSASIYVSLEKVILYLWISISQSVKKENGPNQNLQICSLQPTELFFPPGLIECYPTQHTGNFK